MADAAVRFLFVERDTARAQHVRDAFQDLKIATHSWSSVVALLLASGGGLSITDAADVVLLGSGFSVTERADVMRTASSDEGAPLAVFAQPRGELQ